LEKLFSNEYADKKEFKVDLYMIKKIIIIIIQQYNIALYNIDII